MAEEEFVGMLVTVRMGGLGFSLGLCAEWEGKDNEIIMVLLSKRVGFDGNRTNLL